MQHSNINGTAIAGKMLNEISTDVENLKQENWGPKLVSIKIGENPAVEGNRLLIPQGNL